MFAFMSGLWVGFSLILAIGAQNAFVLKQGLKRRHVFWVCFICALSDTLLIGFGITGFSKIVTAYPLLLRITQYLGAGFLLIYGAWHFYLATKGASRLVASQLEHDSFLKVILTCLALTWLNPHVYLDTVILVSSIALQFSDQIYLFAAGCMLASWIFFFALGYGAKLLIPFFQKPISWQILDLIIGLIMWSIAFGLLQLM